jgi:hypothetical protein
VKGNRGIQRYGEHEKEVFNKKKRIMQPVARPRQVERSTGPGVPRLGKLVQPSLVHEQHGRFGRGEKSGKQDAYTRSDNEQPMVGNECGKGFHRNADFKTQKAT